MDAMSQPDTAQEMIERYYRRCLDEGQDIPDKLIDRVERVLALHQPIDRKYAKGNAEMCKECNRRWPCATRRKFDGLE